MKTIKKIARFLLEKHIIIALLMVKYKFNYRQAKSIYINWYKTFKTL